MTNTSSREGEKRVDKIEKLLENVLKRLEAIEKLLLSSSQYSSSSLSVAAARLATAFSLSIVEAVEAANRLLTVGKYVVGDPIALAIVESLSDCSQLTISDIARRLRIIRGRASRTTIREKIRILEKKKIVENIGSRERPKYVLRECLK